MPSSTSLAISAEVKALVHEPIWNKVSGVTAAPDETS